MSINPLITHPSVIITGASTGIGKACALYLDDLGFEVFAGVRKKRDAENLKKQSSNNLIPILIDITDNASVRKAFKSINHTIGKIGLNGLVNNAGIAIGGPLEFIPLEQINKQLKVNVLGQVRIIQTFLPLLRKCNGRIINISSISGRISGPFIGPYAASKFAMEAISDTLRMELRQWNIPVSIIEPGRVSTPLWEKSLAFIDKIYKHLPANAKKLYGPMLTKANNIRKIKSNSGISPETVAKIVVHVLTVKRPKTRYLVGKDVKLLTLIAKFLPDRVLDKFLIKLLGIET